ncbi:type VI secretion system-associated protein TagF [Pseudomonas sp. CDFA 602]|uniref:type VI secretion system-associated protein TagF n=1 Tax=Pseudomonas californiensis TaxID=2829823 RepID=UPI001E43E317|nr:type VI secretion system-associated protein TagF [Pseudomonas californiensis]MCD5995974.1 type VI secretion system-associated protein TagF [Pseudomonas californiensis]MCD6001585.1 type VI secretion system-associated protein TagF [Pseudomonas californiensis]
MTTVGFYGKLASRGDFVSRGLPQSFIQAWDAWLAAGLLASQKQLGQTWLDAYLVSPLWRFVLAPDVCGPQAVAGVLMPSIDRVGRYFPLTVALPIEADQASGALIGAADDWFERAEELLLATLEPQATFESFEAGLHALGAPAVAAREPAVEFSGLQRTASDTPQARLAALVEWACEGASVWWGKGSESIAPGMLRCRGLPAAADFGSFLLGKGAEVK